MSAREDGGPAAAVPDTACDLQDVPPRDSIAWQLDVGVALGRV